MKLEVPNTSLSPLAYFLAGALLPTIAYVFLLRNKEETPKFEFDDEDGTNISRRSSFSNFSRISIR